MPARHALVVSAAVHAVVVAIISGRAISLSALGPAPRGGPTIPTIEVVTVAPRAPAEELVVALVTLPPDDTHTAAATATTTAPSTAPTRGRIERRGATGATTGVEPVGIGTEPGPVGTPEPGTGPSKMRMRGHDLRVPERAMTDFLASSKPLVEVPRSGKLQQNGRQHVVRDLVTTMTVDEDGQVTFKDKPDVEAHWALPIPSRKGIGDLIAAWYEDPYAQTRFRAVQEMAPHEQAVPGGWDAGAGGDHKPNGKEAKPGDPPTGGPTIPIIGGTFDLTAYAMRKVGIDPYASRKLKLLDDTRDERVEIGAAHTARQLGRSSELMQRNVERLWLATPDPAARRAALFALWDECAEGESSRGEAGQRARAIVIGWIRAHVPVGSPGAFTAAEIAALDGRRTSTQHFVPYGP